MRYLLEFLSNPVVWFSFVTIVCLIVLTVVHFQISVVDKAKTAADKAFSYRFKIDNEKTRKREQLTKIGKKESLWVVKYRMAVTSVKIALNVTFLSVENFTTMFIVFGLMVWGVASFLLNNVALGFLLAVPSVFAALAFLLVLTKKKIRANDNAVMDALDAICPSVNLGIQKAISTNMSSFDRRIVHHFEWFNTATTLQGYDFAEAMDELAVRLGPRFNEFANKAKVFDEYYRAGMEDIFKDIIEANNDTRSDNVELDELFAKKNQDLLMVSALLGSFLGYMYVSPLTKDFMLDSFWGQLVTAVEVSLLVLIYSVSQLLQVDIPDIDTEKLEK